ncbi:MAG: hypothetical protein JXB62_07925, partial [Pirellulales bacterium]|nr:hypothetical protein [Pirellulales bacterium]
ASTDESDSYAETAESTETAESESDAGSDADYSYEYDKYGVYEYESERNTWEQDNAAGDGSEAGRENSGYNGYSVAYPEQENAYVESPADDPCQYQDPCEYEDPCKYEDQGAHGYEYDYGYEYSYPEDKYGYEEDFSSEAEQSGAQDEASETADSESGLELSYWLPSEVLIASDREVLAELARLSEEPAGVRHARLFDYLESLGWEAADFVERFEDTTGIEVLDLADDPPAAAALLAAFRLVERGEVEMDRGIDMLWRGFEGLSEEWLRDVNEITSEQPQWDDSSSTRRAAAELLLC